MEQQSPMNILVTLDEAYLPRLRVLLTSLYLTDPNQPVELYLLHRAIPEEALERLAEQLRPLRYRLHPVVVDEALFAEAPVSKRYPQEMYYRLLAGQLLPRTLKRVLYLDPDLLVINPVRPLWTLDLQGRMFAAAAHTHKTELSNTVNNLRLGTEHKYYNSGVLVIDLDECRRKVQPEEVFRYAREHADDLVLPDQDILNCLYGRETLEVDDYLWNYDARKFRDYYLRSGGESTVEWVMQYTAILHFCGKAKPWKPRYRHRFGVLYQHYTVLSRRLLGE
ncbi:MAG: glycosyltransferase family 8 protein [Clostridiales bacterium]|nr:glycosyltransferase family 8 protein [Clostridiales bacterium]